MLMNGYVDTDSRNHSLHTYSASWPLAKIVFGFSFITSGINI